MAASNKPTAVHFSLIIFVMLTLLSTVVAFIMYRDHDEMSKKLAATESSAGANRNTLTDRDNEIQELKKLIGYGFDEVGLHEPDNPNTLIGAMRNDMKTYGRDLQEPTYKATMQQVSAGYAQMTTDRDAKQAEVDKLTADYAALQSVYLGKNDQLTTRATTAEGDLQDLVDQREEALKTKDDQVASLRTDNSNLAVELQQEQENHAKAIQEKNAENQKLIAINIKLNDEIDNIRQVSFERADGEIRWVDHARGLVWINLGQADRLPKRTTFSVYSRDHHGVGRGQEDIKGSIEVVRIINAHLAEARIQDDDIYRPMAPGDPIYTPLWGPGQKESFSFIGFIDLDGDGISDRRLLHEIIAAAGSKIDNEVGEDGIRIPEGASITVNTKFLVIGELPDPAETSDVDEQQLFEQILETHKTMQSEARQQGVRVISLGRFKSYIGYKPKQRLWKPGMKVGYRLKAGSHSTAVDETIRNRESSGQVSGAFSRSKQLKQQQSSGQTSGVYGRGK